MKPTLLSLLAFLTLTQCARTETVDALPAPTAPTIVPTQPSGVKLALGADDAAEAAVRVPIDGLPSFGDARAPVTVVAFTDYECPYCAKADASLELLREEYGDKLRVVIAQQPLPIHERAADAARAFVAAVRQDKGEAMHKKLFAMNRAKTPMDDANLESAARELGLDVDAFNRARRDETTAAALARSQALALRLDVRGTPTFFTNGRRLVGARPIEAFRALFDEEAIKASKIPSADVYGALMKVAPEPAPPKPGMPEALEHFDVDLAKAPTRGTPNGPITVVLFSDFECPFCVKAEKTLRDLEASKPGQVKVAYKFRPLPFHSHARQAAKASLAAEKQHKFWPYHDVLVQHRDALEPADLSKYAGEVGLDVARFERDLADPEIEERIQGDEKQAIALGARGAPTAFINGYRLVGAQPLEKWNAIAELSAKR